MRISDAEDDLAASQLGQLQRRLAGPIAMGPCAVDDKQGLRRPTLHASLGDLAVWQVDGPRQVATVMKRWGADIQQDEIGHPGTGLMDVPAIGLERERSAKVGFGIGG